MHARAFPSLSHWELIYTLIKPILDSQVSLAHTFAQCQYVHLSTALAHV